MGYLIMHRLLLLSLLGLTFIGPAYAQKKPARAAAIPPWQGDWRWKDPHMPEASHYLRLRGPLGKPSGEYAGNETAEGIVYFKMPVSGLKITAQHAISFAIGPHGLTRTPLTLSSKNLPIGPQSEGASGVRFTFHGQLTGKVLTLHCKADDDMSCPSPTLRFEKIR
jgi:hypothetical protein